MPLLYALASYALFAVLWPVLLFHPKTRANLGRRLGFYPRDFLAQAPRPRIWLHGASAGDVLTLWPMVRALRAERPGCTLVVSTLTNSGQAMARARLRGDPGLADAVIVAPFDLPGAAARAVRAVKPDLLVLEYTELWPNLIRAAKRAGAKVALTNGRFSPRGVGRYRLLFRLIGNPLRALDLFLMRSPEEAERALALGAPPSRVQVTGNTKFDALLPRQSDPQSESLRQELGLRPGEPVLMAGSTHEGEEGPLLDVFQRLRANHPSLRLVLAPRYVERAAAIASLAQARGLGARRRSQGPGVEPILLLDTIGELARAYALATVVFVGGSFTARGGQNILEPATQGKPVLFGPHMDNFADSVALLLGHGGLQVQDPEQLFGALGDLLAHPDRIAALGEEAARTVGEVHGASARNVQALLGLLPQ